MFCSFLLLLSMHNGPKSETLCLIQDQDVSNSTFEPQSNGFPLSRMKLITKFGRKTKIVCTIGPSTSSREMIWKLAETGMNVARLNMSHGDHFSHQKTIDLVKEYNAQFKDKVIAIMLDTKVMFSASICVLSAGF